MLASSQLMYLQQAKEITDVCVNIPKKITKCHGGTDTPAVKVDEVCEHHTGGTFKSPGIESKEGISFRRSECLVLQQEVYCLRCCPSN